MSQEAEEYIQVLKDQLEDKNRQIQDMTKTIAEKEQEIILMKELLKGNSRMNDL